MKGRQVSYAGLRAWLFATAVTIGLIIIGLVALILWQSYQNVTQAEERDSRNLIRSIESQVDKFLREYEQFLTGIGYFYHEALENGSFDEKKLHDHLVRREQEMAESRVLFILDVNRTALVSARLYPVPDRMKGVEVGFWPKWVPGDADYFVGELRKGRVEMLFPGETPWGFPVFKAVKDSNGVLRGYVAAILRPNVFASFIDGLEVGARGAAQVWSSNGRLIAGRANGRFETGEISDVVQARFESYRSGEISTELSTFPPTFGENAGVVSVKGLEGGQLAAAIFLSSEDYLRPWINTAVLMSIAAVLALSALTAMTLFIASQLKQRTENEFRLETAMAEAEDASKAKSQFLAQVSHELRTPLNAIIGFSEVIKTRAFGNEISDRYSEYVNHIHDSSHHLLHLVDDLMDLSQVELGSNTTQDVLIDVGSCVRDILNISKELPGAQSLKFSLALPDTPLIIRGDERRLAQVLLNLLSNAVKFSDDGGAIDIVVHEANSTTAEVSIKDQAGGIDPKVLKRVGEPFLHQTAHATREGQGAGLGLSIAKRLIEEIGGTLTLESEPGQGTTAIIRILIAQEA